MNAEEKKLVGKYVRGNAQTGWLSSSNSFTSHGSFSASAVIWFKPDGTFVDVSYYTGSWNPGGSVFIRATGNWKIPAKGTIRISNMVENSHFGDGSTQVWHQAYAGNWDPNRKYAFTVKEGKQGINYFDNFYQKVS